MIGWYIQIGYPNLQLFSFGLMDVASLKLLKLTLTVEVDDFQSFVTITLTCTFKQFASPLQCFYQFIRHTQLSKTRPWIHIRVWYWFPSLTGMEQTLMACHDLFSSENHWKRASFNKISQRCKRGKVSQRCNQHFIPLENCEGGIVIVTISLYIVVWNGTAADIGNWSSPRNEISFCLFNTR